MIVSHFPFVVVDISRLFRVVTSLLSVAILWSVILGWILRCVTFMMVGAPSIFSCYVDALLCSF